MDRAGMDYVPSCSILPFFFATGPPASTPDTLLMVDMLLAALGSGLPEPGAGCAASAWRKHMQSVGCHLACRVNEPDTVTAKLPCSLGRLKMAAQRRMQHLVHPILLA